MKSESKIDSRIRWESERHSNLNENFDAAPYPFAVLLGATTLLLLVTTVRSLWMLATV